jgi:hypothetical protein
MMSDQTNGIATPDQIRQARRAERVAKGLAVTAPSGARYRLYRPTAGELLVLTGMLPQSIAAQITPADEERSLTLAEQIEMARQRAALLELVIVEPAVALHAMNGELSLLEIPEADREFVWRWAYGEIASDGSDLRSFRGTGEPTSSAS